MQKLLNEALQARKKAYAPYSGFFVGAAVQTKNGNIYTGCNIENASYGATVCAERVAIFQAIAQGETELEKIAVAEAGDITPPCGLCLQVMREFGIKTVYLINTANKWRSYTLTELLPISFGPHNLE